MTIDDELFKFNDSISLFDCPRDYSILILLLIVHSIFVFNINFNHFYSSFDLQLLQETQETRKVKSNQCNDDIF